MPFWVWSIVRVAAAILAVIQLATISTVDLPQTVALYAFAVSIPVGVLSLAWTNPLPSAVDDIIRGVCRTVATYAVFIGFAAIFFHFSAALGTVFVVVSGIARGLLFIDVRARAQQSGISVWRR